MKLKGGEGVQNQKNLSLWRGGGGGKGEGEYEEYPWILSETTQSFSVSCLKKIFILVYVRMSAIG